MHIARRIVCLDTCTIRNLVHGKAETCAALAQLAKYRDRVSFRVSDSAFAELNRQLLDQQFPWHLWRDACKTLRGLVDPAAPIQGSGVDIKALNGLSTADGPQPLDLQYFRNAWDLLSTSSSREEYLAGRVYKGSDGESYELAGSKSLTSGLCDDEVKRWVSIIQDSKLAASGRVPTFDEICAAIAYAIDRDKEGKTIFGLYDAYIRSIARFVHMALAPATPYNPTSDKRRGDAFDLELLQVLSIDRALVCTDDSRLVGHVNAAESPQADRVLSPAAVAALLKGEFG